MIILWVVIGCLGLLLLLLLAAVIRTLLEPGKRSDYEPAPNPERAEEYAKKLSAMVRCETVSAPDEDLQYKIMQKKIVSAIKNFFKPKPLLIRRRRK